MEAAPAAPPPAPEPKRTNVFAILGIIFAFVGGVLGIIFSIIGLVRAGTLKSGRALSVVALVISLIVTGVGGYVGYKLVSIDPGCIAANNADNKYSPRIKQGANGEGGGLGWAAAVTGLATDLGTAAAKTKDATIKAAIEEAARDQVALLQAASTGGDTSAISAKATADEDKIKNLCNPF